jgi:hypothetical protein
MWRSTVELDEGLDGTPELGKLVRLYSLSLLWHNSVYAKDYRASVEWNNIVELTPSGKNAREMVAERISDIPQPDIQLAFFARFFHHDLFVDHNKTDVSAIWNLLNSELSAERLKLPDRYGRRLYDRFNDTYEETRTDHLMPAEVDKLLEGTPTGISQVGKLVSGPLGIIESEETRCLPPTLKLPLWHCSDTGCETLHYVALRQPVVPVVEAILGVKSTLEDILGPPSEWSRTFFRLLHGARSRRYVDLPAVLADCVIGKERTALLQAALQGNRGERLRAVLAAPPRRKRDSEGPAATVAARQSAETQIQLLLVLPDGELIQLIDEVVAHRGIRIPLGEVRKVEYSVPQMPKDRVSQLSALGIRSSRPQPVVNLISSVWRSYQSLGLSSELEWRVRGDASNSLFEATASYIRSRNPADSVRELILSSAKVTEKVCQDLGIPIRYASGTDNLTVDRLLWKLGFNPMQFDDSISRFRSRLSDFSQVLLTAGAISTEDVREKVRAAGVNVFVSLEEFLDKLISYNVWLLSSDHFLRTDFCYSTSDGRLAVKLTLGENLQSGDETLNWRTEGDNPLGTLLRYLRGVAEWIKELPGRDRDKLLRPTEDMPHFAHDRDLKFPFCHTALWADADVRELQRYSDVFGQVVRLIEESDPSAVRNGLDHFRDPEEFPTVDKLLANVARLSQAIEMADANRFVPKVFWLLGRKANRFGASEYEFKDYASRSVFTYGPFLVSGLGPLSYGIAYLLAPGNLLGSPNSSISFALKEKSEYSDYWQNYPRRRRIPPQDEDKGKPETPPDPPSDVGMSTSGAGQLIRQTDSC